MIRPAELVGRPGAALRAVRRRQFRGFGVTGWVMAAVLAVVGLFAALGPLLITTDPTAVNLAYANVGPVPGHLLGFDGQGRDLLSRLAWGSRTALLGPLIVVCISTVLGCGLGLSGSWIGGWLDRGLSRVVDAMFAFPGLLLAILAVSLFGPSVWSAAVSLSIAYTPYVARIVRAAALRERPLPYVAALEVQGFRGIAIIWRHVLPNIFALVVAGAALSFGYALIDLASLSFIGLGVQPPQPDWGQMVANGVPGILQGYPQESLFAGAIIVVTVAAVNVLADRLTAARDGGAG